MESRVIQLTPAAHKYGNLNIRPCGLDFFPKGILGGSTKANPGIQITIKADGLPNPIKTDIPTDNKTGKPRWIFRRRGWVRKFVTVHNLNTGDTIVVNRIAPRDYLVIPEKIESDFVKLEPSNNKQAIITHYLHNIDNGVSKHFKKDAMKFVKESVQYKDEDKNISMVARRALQQLLFEVENVPFPSPENYTFKFIDLFAGVGGFRIAMQNLGGKCVFTSEWDKEAQRTYRANFGEVPFGDITKEDTKKYIPNDFDLLCAGFPCQAFSIAGRRGGFDDTRGTLFFDVAEIIKRKKPKAIFLENVKGLRRHDKGKTLEIILNVLRNDLNYFIPEPKIINAKDFGVPQRRERIYIVGFRKDQNVTKFEYPKPTGKKIYFSQVKEKKVVRTRYYLSTQYLQTLRNHKARHKSKGNGFGFVIVQDNEIANAIVVGGMGKERNLVIDNRIKDFIPETKIKGVVNREGIRKMTPREWARLQGFPDKYIIPVADASAYKQFGNSVAVPAIQATANKILETIGIKNYANRK